MKLKNFISSGVPVIALVISAIALVISAIVAYYGSILQVEELRVLARIDTEQSNEQTIKYVLPGHWQLVFINSGTRAIAIIHTWMMITDKFAEASGGPCGASLLEATLETDLAPFVIKGSDIVSKKINLKRVAAKKTLSLDQDGNVSFAGMAGDDFLQIHKGEICFVFDLATPSNEYVNGRSLDAMDYEFMPQGITFGFSARSKPTVVWRSTKFIFQQD